MLRCVFICARTASSRRFAASVSFDPESTAAGSARIKLTEQLAQLQLYVVLSPLEKLFARPDRRNCLSETMLAALQAAVDGAGRDAGVRAMVIAAQGSVFCAGHDLKELTQHRRDADRG